MTAAHSILPPSGAAAWLACSAWVLMNQMYPESDKHKADSDAGTASHWAASEILFGRLVDVGQVAPNGIVLTDEMIDGAELYVEAIDARLKALGVGREFLHVEEKIYCPDIHAESWGTPDAWFYVPTQAALEIFDYKFGHRYIDDFENWQLINYASGILREIDINGMSDQTLEVRMHVIQPRAYHRNGPVRTWLIKASELRGYFNRLNYAAHLALSPGAKATANPACLDCVGRVACEVGQRDAYRTADISFASLPVELPDDALGLELKFLREAAKRLEGRITGLEDQARQRIMSGKLVRFFSMVPSVGKEKWVVPESEVVTLGQIMGKDLEKRDVVTPNQARQIFKKAGLPTDVIAQFSERVTSLSLEYDDGTNARKVFGK